ncbi:MAG: hypothetical protein BHV77_04910 [Bacteroides sp. 43_108]|nr:MAG: hypothetical protein BHV77_04910 [Bacteroides sp. 43_108]
MFLFIYILFLYVLFYVIMQLCLLRYSKLLFHTKEDALLVAHPHIFKKVFTCVFALPGPDLLE